MALAIIFSLDSFAINPHMKITVARENYVRSTKVGFHLLRKMDTDNIIAVFNCFDSYEGKCAKPYVLRKNEIHIHADFISASPEYLSWIVFMAYQDYSLKFQFEQNQIPETIEYKNLLFKYSMIYLKELVAECDIEADYYSHPKFDFARKVDLPMCELYKLSNDQTLLYERVTLRSKVTEGLFLTVQDILDSDKFSTNQKKIATRLLTY